MGALDELRQTFFEECEEQLAELEAGLLEMQAGSADGEVVNAVFRAVHSVKGGAGAFELQDLVAFAHVFETTLDEVRDGRLPATPELVRVMLRGSDMLADLVAAARAGEAADEAAWRPVAAEIEAAGRGGSAAAAPAARETPAEAETGGLFEPVPIAIEAPPAAPEDFAPLKLDLGGLLGDGAGAGAASAGGAAAAAGWRRRFRVMFRPHASLYAKANDAVMLLRELDRLGEARVETDLAELPALDALDPFGAWLSFTIVLDTDADWEAVRDVFEFCEEDCDLVIREETPPEGDAAPASGEETEAGDEAAAPQAEASAPPAAPVAAPVAALAAPAAEAVAAKPAEPAEAAPAAAPAPAPAEAPGRPERRAEERNATIRVDLDRVDRLINLVGELVINQAMLSQAVHDTELARNAAVAGGLDELDQLTREIQESVMAIRAQPLKPIFQRMTRIVRETAEAVGKTVRLVSEGEWTEVDKTVVERLADPLTHMIRNAVDHGLETPEARRAAGKPEEGVVRLSAAHRSGRVVIEISDDGRGVNRERVRARAIERGLIAPDAQLSEAELDNLLFAPGFSTAAAVSNISGRGVGMDVVKKSIQALSGRIFMRSKEGVGSTFTLSLPLTLAVLDGMVVTVAGQTLVAPLSAIVETMSLGRDRVRSFGESGAVVHDRGGFAPLVDTGAELGFRPPRDFAADPEGIALLVESEGGGRSALMVDAIQDQRQVVIKSIESNYGRAPGVAAATILGDGRVALILDVDALVSRARGGGGVDALMAAE